MKSDSKCLAKVFLGMIVTGLLVVSAMSAGITVSAAGKREDIEREGSPTATQITDWYDLNATRQNLAGDYVLMNDLDENTSGYNELVDTQDGWDPIDGWDPFTGTFDGQGYEIRDLYINKSSTNDIGLFASADNGAEIKNLGVVDANVTGDMFSSVLVGRNVDGYLNNTYATGTLKGDNWYFGGLTSINKGSVNNSYTSVAVNATGNEEIGGLVGTNEGTVNNSYATGEVIGKNNVGGLVGLNEDNKEVRNSHATGDVTGVNSVGGLVGKNDELGNITNSSAAGDVKGSESAQDGYVGGLVGRNGGMINRSYATGDVNGSEDVGGFVGRNDAYHYNGGFIWDSYATGNVSGNDDVGGFAGDNFAATINRSYSTGNVSGDTDDVGGFTGDSTYNEASEEDSYWNVVTSGQTDSGGNGKGRNTWDMTWEYSTDTYEGWDMSEKQGEATWWSGDHRVVMDHEGNTGYPALSWQEGHGYFEFSQVKNQSAGVQFEITITAYDKNDEKKTDYDGTVNLTDTTGTITPGEANFTGGNWTGGVTITKSQEDVKITAVDQNDVTLIGDSNTFDVTPGATDHVEIKPENSTIMAGGTQTYNATAYDQYGNKEEVTGETNWSDDVVPTNASSWVDNEITVDQKGNWTVIGEYDGVQGTANLTVEQYVEYDLTININGEGSTDPGEGTYSYAKGTEVTVQAIEDVDGWSFNEWTGDHTGTSNEINITIDDNKNITANFEIHTYGLFIDISGQGTVDIEPDQAQYEHGTEVNLTAIPDQNWNFVEWTGDYQGTSENITIVMDENKQITAHFSDTVYHTLKISIEGEGSTDPVEGNHTYEEGTDVNITATAAEGWYFQEWTGDIQSTEQNITITMDRDKNITSWFYIYEYDLDISTEGEGSTDPAEGVHSYEHGREVNITATAAEDWNFVRWKGDNGTVGDTKANTTTITMNDNYSITAKFEVIGGVTYDLTVDSSSGGSVIEPGEGTFTYSENTEVDVQADADQGYEFVEWIGDNGTVGDTEANATTITMDENKSITATFQETVETNTLRLDVEGNGTVKVNGTEVDVPFEEDYEVDTTVELEANASEGWTFTNWTGSVQSDLDSITIIMDEDKNVTAHFEEVPTERHSLSVNIEGNGTVELDGQEVEDGWSQEFDDGVNVTLNAVADEDYTFAGWSGMDKTGQEIEVSIDSDVEITAHFEKAKYELTLSTDGQGSVDRDPERSEYEEGTNVTLTAQPEDGWEFSHWEGDPLEGVVEDDEINITVKDNFNITAYFQEAGGGDDSGEDTADKGEDDSGWLWWLIPLIIVLVIVIALAAWYTQKGDEDEEEEDLSEDLFPEEGTGSTESPPQPSEESMGSEEAPEPEGIGEDEDPFEDEQFEG